MGLFYTLIDDLAKNLFGNDDPFVTEMYRFYYKFQHNVMVELNLKSLPKLTIRDFNSETGVIVGSYIPEDKHVVLNSFLLEFIDNLQHSYIDRLTKDKKWLFVYAHELVHYRQHITGKLKYYNNHWTYDGKIFPMHEILQFSSSSNPVYSNWPWEVEANEEALRVVNKIMW